MILWVYFFCHSFSISLIHLFSVLNVHISGEFRWHELCSIFPSVSRHVGQEQGQAWCKQYCHVRDKRWRKNAGNLSDEKFWTMSPNRLKLDLFAAPAVCVQSATLPSSLRNKRTLKSSLSKTSSLKRNTTNKFETQENLQQIVKQKRENCLQVKHSFLQG